MRQVETRREVVLPGGEVEEEQVGAAFVLVPAVRPAGAAGGPAAGGGGRAAARKLRTIMLQVNVESYDNTILFCVSREVLNGFVFLITYIGISHHLKF